MSQQPLRIVRGEDRGASSETPAPLDFDDFFAAHSEELFRKMWLVTRDRAEAEEAMQDAFLRLYERWDRMDDDRRSEGVPVPDGIQRVEQALSARRASVAVAAGAARPG